MKPSHQFKNILYCTDFSPNADCAYQVASQMAQQASEAKMTILHVIPDPEAQFWNTYLPEFDLFEAQARADVKQQIEERYVAPLQGQVETNIAIPFGKDATEILNYLKKHPIDLVVMGRQGKSEWSTLFFGSVTEKVSRHAGCTVMIVPSNALKKESERTLTLQFKLKNFFLRDPSKNPCYYSYCFY